MDTETKNMPYVIARGSGSGVHAGHLAWRSGAEVELRHARRLWYWEGATTLSQLAEEGTKKPGECKFPTPVSRIIKTDVCEILFVSDEAKASIESVPVWEATR
mgnify:FL=1